MRINFNLKGFFILTAMYFNCAGQSPNMLSGDLEEMAKPRNKYNAEKPGRYELVPQVQKTELNPGDPLDIDIYFSGYGEIAGSKALFSTVKGIFEPHVSYVQHSIKYENKIFSWGKDTLYLSGPSRFSLTIRGVTRPGWGESTIYLDVKGKDTTNYLLRSELPMPGAPIYVHLQTKKDIEPGPYSLIIVYTYYNGQEWVGSTQTINFKVKNWIERNPFWTWALGILLAVLALGPTVVQFLNWCKVGFRNENKVEKVIPQVKVTTSPTKKKSK
jgi:hypothetical protein